MYFYLVLFLLFVPCGALQKQIILENKCPQDVYFTFTTGAAPYANTTITRCSTLVDCSEGSYCASNGICFRYKPAVSSYLLEVNKTRLLQFPYLTTQNVVWSGNIAACMDYQCRNKNLTQCAAQIRIQSDQNGVFR